MSKPKRKEVFLTKIVSVSSMGNIYGVISMNTKVLIFNQKYTLINRNNPVTYSHKKNWNCARKTVGFHNSQETVILGCNVCFNRFSFKVCTINTTSVLTEDY